MWKATAIQADLNLTQRITTESELRTRALIPIIRMSRMLKLSGKPLKRQLYTSLTLYYSWNAYVVDASVNEVRDLTLTNRTLPVVKAVISEATIPKSSIM